jgi:c-di-GMP-binding flagellar brake protein YcgR
MKTGEPRQRSTRRYRRYILDTEIRVLAGPQTEPVRSRTLDISEGGIAGIFNAGWDIGEPALLHFSVPPKHEVLEARAIVRSRSGTRFGFEFVELNPDSRVALQSACSYLRSTR